MSFVERFVILCPYLGESTIEGSTVYIDMFQKFCPPSVPNFNYIYQNILL